MRKAAEDRSEQRAKLEALLADVAPEAPEHDAIAGRVIDAVMLMTRSSRIEPANAVAFRHVGENRSDRELRATIAKLQEVEATIRAFSATTIDRLAVDGVMRAHLLARVRELAGRGRR